MQYFLQQVQLCTTGVHDQLEGIFMDPLDITYKLNT